MQDIATSGGPGHKSMKIAVMVPVIGMNLVRNLNDLDVLTHVVEKTNR